MGLLKKKGSNKQKRNEEESRAQDDDIRKRTNSMDSIKKRWSFRKKKKDDANVEISNVELVYSTYSGTPEPIEGMAERKPQSPPPDMDFPDRIGGGGMKGVDVPTEGKDSGMAKDDMNALKDLLQNLSVSNENQLDKIPNKFTAASNNDSPTDDIQAPPTTPEDACDIPRPHMLPVVGRRDDDNNNNNDNKSNININNTIKLSTKEGCNERKSEVLEDSRLLDKLLVVEREAKVCGKNIVVIDPIEKTTISVDEYENNRTLLDDEMISSDDIVDKTKTRIVRGSDELYNSQEYITLDEHANIQSMAKLISENQHANASTGRATLTTTIGDGGDVEENFKVVIQQEKESSPSVDTLVSDDSNDNKSTSIAVNSSNNEEGTKAIVVTPELDKGEKQRSERISLTTAKSIENVDIISNVDVKETNIKILTKLNTYDCSIPSREEVMIHREVGKDDSQVGIETSSVLSVAEDQMNMHYKSDILNEMKDTLQDVRSDSNEFPDKENNEKYMSGRTPSPSKEDKETQVPVESKKLVNGIDKATQHNENIDKIEGNTKNHILENLQCYAECTSDAVLSEALENITTSLKSVNLQTSVDDTATSTEENIIPVMSISVESEVKFSDDVDDAKKYLHEKLQQEIDMTKQMKIGSSLESHTTDCDTGKYDSACSHINPRIKHEIEDRDRRIQELLRRSQRASEDEELASLTEQQPPSTEVSIPHNESTFSTKKIHVIIKMREPRTSEGEIEDEIVDVMVSGNEHIVNSSKNPPQSIKSPTQPEVQVIEQKDLMTASEVKTEDNNEANSRSNDLKSAHQVKIIEREDSIEDVDVEMTDLKSNRNKDLEYSHITASSDATKLEIQMVLKSEDLMQVSEEEMTVSNETDSKPNERKDFGTPQLITTDTEVTESEVQMIIKTEDLMQVPDEEITDTNKTYFQSNESKDFDTPQSTATDLDVSESEIRKMVEKEDVKTTVTSETDSKLDETKVLETSGVMTTNVDSIHSNMQPCQIEDSETTADVDLEDKDIRAVIADTAEAQIVDESTQEVTPSVHNHMKVYHQNFGLTGEMVSLRKALIKELLIKMSQCTTHPASLTIKKEEGKFHVEMSSSLDNLNEDEDISSISSGDGVYGASEDGKGNQENIEEYLCYDDSNHSQSEDENEVDGEPQQVKDSRVEKLAFAIMTKYHSLDIPDETAEPVTGDINNVDTGSDFELEHASGNNSTPCLQKRYPIESDEDSDSITPLEIAVTETEVEFSWMEEEEIQSLPESPSTKKFVTPKMFIMHGSLADVEYDEEEEIKESEKKLTKNDFFANQPKEVIDHNIIIPESFSEVQAVDLSVLDFQCARLDSSPTPLKEVQLSFVPITTTEGLQVLSNKPLPEGQRPLVTDGAGPNIVVDDLTIAKEDADQDDLTKEETIQLYSDEPMEKIDGVESIEPPSPPQTDDNVVTERKDSKTFRKRPSLGRSSVEPDELQQEIRRSIVIDENIVNSDEFMATTGGDIKGEQNVDAEKAREHNHSEDIDDSIIVDKNKERCGEFILTTDRDINDEQSIASKAGEHNHSKDVDDLNSIHTIEARDGDDHGKQESSDQIKNNKNNPSEQHETETEMLKKVNTNNANKAINDEVEEVGDNVEEIGDDVEEVGDDDVSVLPVSTNDTVSVPLSTNGIVTEDDIITINEQQAESTPAPAFLDLDSTPTNVTVVKQQNMQLTPVLERPPDFYILPRQHRKNQPEFATSIQPEIGADEEIVGDEALLKKSHSQLMNVIDGEDTLSNESACHVINPRIEREIDDRERRIKALLLQRRSSSHDDGIEEDISASDVNEHYSQPFTTSNQTDADDQHKFVIHQVQLPPDESTRPPHLDENNARGLESNLSDVTPLDDNKDKQQMGVECMKNGECREDCHVPHLSYKGAALCASGTVVNTENIVVPHSLPPQSLDNDQKVTLEIRGDRFVEHGDTMRYEDTNGRRHQMIPVKLSSIKYRRPQKITLELRSAGPLIGQAVKEESLLSTHTIEVRQTKSNNTPSCQQVYTTQTKQTYHSPDEHSIQKNFKEVLIVIDNVNAENDDSSDAEQQQPNMRILPQTDL